MKWTVHHPNGAQRGLVLALCLLHGSVVLALDDAPTVPATDEVEVVGPAGERPALPKTFGSSDIKDWYAPDSRTLIINTYGHGRFKATLTSGCAGIRSAETLGFTTMGPFELDSSTTVVLPDGARCGFSDLIAVPLEESAPVQSGD
jgi:hypothetical protein